MVPKEDERDKELNALERIYSELPDKKTDIEEVWFAVCYFNVLKVYEVALNWLGFF